MSDIKHSPLPWQVREKQILALNGDDLFHIETADIFKQEDADFIVRACNSHYELIEALEMIIARSKDNKPGTSKVLDMQAIAMFALTKAKGETND